jgi:hypothetical protein
MEAGFYPGEHMGGDPSALDAAACPEGWFRRAEGGP